MAEYYRGKGCPTVFPVRTKCIALFQKIHGVDTLLFALYVYEYGQNCPAPNRRRVYISYLDSVQYFEPKCYRTAVYHSILIEYLRYVKARGFHTAHLWSCPPTPGDDYVFYCHPKHQKVPREDMLRGWYHSMLDKAKALGIVIRTTTLYDEYFKSDAVDVAPLQRNDATCLPYFEGDYIPGEVENIIRQLKVHPHPASDGKGEAQDDVMARLGHNLRKMQDNFIVVHLRNRRFASAVERGDDVSNWREDSDEELIRSKRAKISGKDTSVPADQVVSNLKSERCVTSPPNVVVAAASASDGGENASVKSELDDGESPAITSSLFATHACPPDEVVPGTTKSEPDADGADSPIKSSQHVESEKPDDLVHGPAKGEHSDRAGEEAPAKQPNLDTSPTRGPVDDYHVTVDPVIIDIPVSRAPAVIDDRQPEALSSIPESAAVIVNNSRAVESDVSQRQVSTHDTESSVILDDKRAVESEESQLQGSTHGIESSVIADNTRAVESVVSQLQVSTHDIESKLGAEDTQLKNLDHMTKMVASHVASCNLADVTVSDTADEDEPFESDLFESRQMFLNYCQTTHCQFDELRRAKHSSMMVLFQLHNPSAPKFLQQCGSCYLDITHGIRYHCNTCPDFDLCQDCYEPVTSGLWAKRDARFAHDKSHSFTAVDMEIAPGTPPSYEDRQKALKAHIDLLEHAGRCPGPPSCALQNCVRMKGLFEHVRCCDVRPKKDCRICCRLLSLCAMHARMCSVRSGACPIPFCDRIRERHMRLRRQQQQMDDRRRQAQNELYHAGDS
jgi:Histone acetylation protein/TAZ zinc finger/Zinc finger, ZZ type